MTHQLREYNYKRMTNKLPEYKCECIKLTKHRYEYDSNMIWIWLEYKVQV